MAISITRSSTNTKEDLKKHNVYDNYDNLKTVVFYDTNKNVDSAIKTTSNLIGKSADTKKFYQVKVDVVEAPYNIGANSVTLKARVFQNEGSLVHETGFIRWVENENKDETVLNKTSYGNTITSPTVFKGSFTKTLTNLADGTTYNYRAYVKHEYGTNYSKVYQFTTLPTTAVFSIAGNTFSGPVPLTVNLSAINAGAGAYTYGWNLTGGNQPADYFTQTITHTFSSAGNYNVKAFALLNDVIVKQATRQIRVIGSSNYTAEWNNITTGAFGNNIVGAYDFRNIIGSSLKDGLLAFWKLDDITDSSGNGNNLTNNNGVTFEPGLVGDGARTAWGNNGSYLTTDVATNGNATLSMWFKYESLPVANPQGYQDRFPLIVQKYPYLGLYSNPNFPRKLILTDLATWGTNPSDFEFTVGEWCHIVITFENGHAKVYANNELILETPANRTNGINTGGRLLGWGGDNVDAATSYGTDTQFDSIGIWNRVLTEAEIETLYNEGNGFEDINTVKAIVGPDLQLVGNTSVITDGDSYWNNVSLLLHMDGQNGSTSITDSSTNTFTLTAQGNAQISTTEKKFNTGSALFDGTGDYIVLEDSSKFNFNTGSFNSASVPFTIEMWFYPTALGTNERFLIAKDTYGSSFSWGIAITDSRISVYTHNINNDWNFTANTTVSLSAWQHVALTHDGTNQRLFLNGVLIGSKSAVITNQASKITIGCASWNNPNAFFQGYIDELRITKGVARYITNFTPDTTPFVEFLGNNTAVQFTPLAYAVADETISIASNPHTLVYVGKVNSQSAPAEVMYIVAQPIKYQQTGDQNVVLFSRPSSGLLPYNGSDNQYINYNPDGSEWYYVALSFLSDNTVRYALRTPTVATNGTVAGATHSAFNGYPMFGAGLGSPTAYNGFGPVRLGMFINRAFSTVQEMNTLFAAITSGPVTDIDLIA